MTISEEITWTGRNCRAVSDFVGIETECSPKCKSSPLFLLYLDGVPYWALPGDVIKKENGLVILDSPERGLFATGEVVS